MMKHLMTDIDGSRYYQTETGDIVTENGLLVDLNTEANIRAHIRNLEPRPPLQRTATAGVGYWDATGFNEV